MVSLTRDEAAPRAELLRVHSYRVDLDLGGAREAARFTSTTTVRFSCTDPGAATFVELKAVTVEEVRLNGVPLDAGNYVGNRLPLAGLRAENELWVRATMACSSTGEGLHRFVDPTDGEVYLYAMAGLDNLTKACLDRFHALFGIRYPFGKYDQAFVAEFNWGAVENPGLVVFRDDEYLFRSAVTRAQREQRAVVIAHEMAHMWFGDLVTLRWWDDIWLNESFAEYMGWRVTVEATPFVDAWTTFAVGRKGGGYAADQRRSTHPVAPTDVDDTAQALANFDGISYAKGASVLRQLVAWLGDETFLSGLRSYFAAHMFGNATLADLLAALSQASGPGSGRMVAGVAVPGAGEHPAPAGQPRPARAL